MPTATNQNPDPMATYANSAEVATKYAALPDTSTISSANTQPQAPINYQSPQYPPVYNSAALSNPTAYDQNTQPQQDAQNLTTRLQSLNDQLSGKAADTTALYKQQGFGTTTDANGNIVADPGTADLTAKLTQLQNEAQAIPLQLQQDATGRGITAGGLAPVQTAALRNNAIQALGVSSLIAAKNGQLVTAQHLVDQALTQKYGPIEAELKAKSANLQLLLNSPDYSNAEKKQAAQQAQIVAQQQAAIEQAKTNYTTTQAEVLKYAGVADAQTLALMQKAQTPAQVAQIAAQAGIQQPQAGRYKDSVTTTTDAFGNSIQHVRVFDTLTGQFVDNVPAGTTSAQLNSQGGGGSFGGSTGPSSGASGAASSSRSNGLSFNAYGSLANTNFNPSGSIDQLAQKYLDTYIKKGAIPSTRDLGNGIKAGALAQIDARARDLYQQATGQPLPNPELIKGYQQQLTGNNKLLNNLNVQEGTIGKNAALLLQNLDANYINQNNQVLNSWIDSVRNTFGDPNVATFLAQNATVGNELGSLLSLKNAQGTTVHDKLEAAGIIGKNDSSAQIAAKVKILLQEAVNARQAIQDANGELYQQTDPLLQDANNPNRTKSINSTKVNQLLSKQNLDYNSLIAEMQPQAPAGHQPAIDAVTGAPFFATPEEISSGKYIPL